MPYGLASLRDWDFPDGPNFFESHAGSFARSCGEPGGYLLRESIVVGKELLEFFYSFWIFKIGRTIFEKIARLSNLILNIMLEKRRDTNNEYLILCFSAYYGESWEIWSEIGREKHSKG